MYDWKNINCCLSHLYYSSFVSTNFPDNSPTLRVCTFCSNLHVVCSKSIKLLSSVLLLSKFFKLQEDAVWMSSSNKLPFNLSINHNFFIQVTKRLNSITFLKQQNFHYVFLSCLGQCL